MIQSSRLQLKEITAEQSFPLRHKILRPEQTLSDCCYEGDFEPTTVHIGAFLNSQLIGICSIYTATNLSLPTSDTCQLRAMATDESARGKGVGVQLLSAAETHAKRHGHSSVWANARQAALGFYQNLGYEVVGDEFDIAGVGPHTLVVKRFANASH